MKEPTRRLFLASAAIFAGSAQLQSCAPSRSTYAEAAAATWRPFRVLGAERDALQRELVRYAALAPSSHNTQCWRFKLETNSISILPDLARRCPAVDPDDHHLFVSLGTATENLVQAARAHGLQSSVRFDAAGGGAVRIAFERAKPVHTSLFAAIPQRQCTRGEYDGKPLQRAELRDIESAGEGNGVRVYLLTARSRMEQVLDYVIQGNTTQMTDPAFMDELRTWIRFNDGEAIAKRDGLITRVTGNPSVPRWLGSLVTGLPSTRNSENAKYTKFIRSSAGIAVFVSEVSDKEHWVETGRCYERFVLQATALGIRTAMLNQPVEVPSLRASFAQSLGIGARRPDLVVRFGRGPQMPRSLRRPVDAVIV